MLCFGKAVCVAAQNKKSRQDSVHAITSSWQKRITKKYNVAAKMEIYSHRVWFSTRVYYSCHARCSRANSCPTACATCCCRAPHIITGRIWLGPGDSLASSHANWPSFVASDSCLTHHANWLDFSTLSLHFSVYNNRGQCKQRVQPHSKAARQRIWRARFCSVLISFQ